MQAQEGANAGNQTMLTSFSLGHDDYVHDISYDFYGKRLATCSSDQKIKIWDKATNEQEEEWNKNGKGEWKLVAELAAHSGIVWKVKWSHPEFGQILASCGYDKSFVIWEEVENKDAKKTWAKRANMMLKENAMDLKFAPKHMGLILAVAVGDGTVILYEGDLQNLSAFTEIQKISVNNFGCSCISWNPAFDEIPMIAVGCQSMAQDHIQQHLPNQLQEPLLQLYGKRESSKYFEMVGQFKGGHQQSVNDVAWAPLAGRSYHMIVSCSKDKSIIVWKLLTKNILAGGALMEQPHIEKFWSVEQPQEVWRVTWNVLGTCFCSSGDDGCIRVWKKNIKNKFSQLATLHPKQAQFK